ncbi:hypothetical protein [Salinarimonas rosea]|uniref:hypothetical protein n=1 Tax=Salinarimonas rosea TaxID=552063 RepID=UPI0004012B46|nr:hypothetical protein [Salinarimonas rosea]
MRVFPLMFAALPLLTSPTSAQDACVECRYAPALMGLSRDALVEKCGAPASRSATTTSIGTREQLGFCRVYGVPMVYVSIEDGRVVSVHQR